MIFFIYIFVLYTFQCDEYCYSCSSCNNALSSLPNGGILCLNESVIQVGNDEICIDTNSNPMSDMTFDCVGGKILGSNLGSKSAFSLYDDSTQKVVIKNCEFEGFESFPVIDINVLGSNVLDEVSIQNCQFKKGNNVYFSNAIDASLVSNLVITDSNFSQVLRAIKCTDCTNSKISENDFTDIGRSIYLVNSDNVIIEKNQFDKAGRLENGTIYGENGNQNTIDLNSFQRSRYHIKVNSWNNCFFKDNFFQFSEIGILLDKSNNNEFRSNLLYKSSYFDVYIHKGSNGNNHYENTCNNLHGFYSGISSRCKYYSSIYSPNYCSCNSCEECSRKLETCSKVSLETDITFTIKDDPVIPNAKVHCIHPYSVMSTFYGSYRKITASPLSAGGSIGVYFGGADNGRVEYLTLDGFDTGILAKSFKELSISFRDITIHNSVVGIDIENGNIYADKTGFQDVTIYDAEKGIIVRNSKYVSFYFIHSVNNEIGIYFEKCQESKIVSSKFINNRNSIYFLLSDNNKINGYFKENGYNGYYLNTFKDSIENAILFEGSENNEVFDGNVFDGNTNSIFFKESSTKKTSGNVIHSNFFYNSSSHVDWSGNDANSMRNNNFSLASGKTETNIVGGPKSGGNYYDNVVFNDPNYDGILDTRYDVNNKGIFDNFVLCKDFKYITGIKTSGWPPTFEKAYYIDYLFWSSTITGENELKFYTNGILVGNATREGTMKIDITAITKYYGYSHIPETHTLTQEFQLPIIYQYVPITFLTDQNLLSVNPNHEIGLDNIYIDHKGGRYPFTFEISDIQEFGNSSSSLQISNNGKLTGKINVNENGTVVITVKITDADSNTKEKQFNIQVLFFELNIFGMRSYYTTHNMNDKFHFLVFAEGGAPPYTFDLYKDIESELPFGQSLLRYSGVKYEITRVETVKDVGNIRGKIYGECDVNIRFFVRVKDSNNNVYQTDFLFEFNMNDNDVIIPQFVEYFFIASIIIIIIIILIVIVGVIVYFILKKNEEKGFVKLSELKDKTNTRSIHEL